MGPLPWASEASQEVVHADLTGLCRAASRAADNIDPYQSQVGVALSYFN
jgi:hypothetical protein